MSACVLANGLKFRSPKTTEFLEYMKCASLLLDGFPLSYLEMLPLD